MSAIVPAPITWTEAAAPPLSSRNTISISIEDPTQVLSVALYMSSMGAFPLGWSALSETFCRRSIYLISFTLFNVFNILSAIATD